MVRYQPVPLPTGAANASHSEVLAGLRGWISSPPMRDLVTAFGGELPDEGTAELLAWLDRFSGIHWDFREKNGNVERDEVTASSFPAETVDLVGAAAIALGLVQPLPAPARSYDHLLILGGLARACLQRTGYAAHLVRTAAVEVGEVAALGSFRPLRDSETAQLDLPGCGYEVDAMDLGIRRAFGFTTPCEQRAAQGEVGHRSWSVRTYLAAGSPRVHVLAAPSTEPAIRRANTPDTCHFWARQVTLKPKNRLLVVTSPIYVPFQHCDAVRTLGLTYGCAVDTIGFDAESIGESRPARNWGTDRYLQEIRSAIRSMGKLFHALDQPATV